MELQLPCGRVALIDDADAPLLAHRRWVSHTNATKTRSNGSKLYVVSYAGGRMVRLHRLLMDAPHGVLVDHVNGDGLDNRRRNLRLTDHSGNRANAAACGGRSRFRGVTWDAQRGKWMARLEVDGRRLYLGRFDSELEAAEAWDATALECWGDMARLNLAGPGGMPPEGPRFQTGEGCDSRSVRVFENGMAA
jgi:hypothetical protein